MKTFIQFLAEMPWMSKSLIDDGLSDAVAEASEKLEKHGTLIKHDIMHYKDGKRHIYGKKGKNGLKSVHIVSDNVHNTVARLTSDAERNDFHDVMIHHITTYGKLSTHPTNTPGSKKLWMSLIEKEPKDIKFHYVKDGVNTSIDKHNLSSHEKEIWGHSPHHTEAILHAIKDKN